MYTSNTPSSSNPSDEKLNVDILKSVPEAPKVDTQVCLKDYKSLQSFLKLSRTTVDDNLNNHLNNILNHNETNTSSIFKFSNFKNAAGKDSSCNELIYKLVYPEWQKRISVINYCQNVVSNSKIDDFEDDPAVINFSNLSTEEKNNLLRIDPYTFKEIEQKFNNKNFKLIELQNLYSNELQIESIVQNRSTERINDICKLVSFDIKAGFVDYAKQLSKQ